MVFTSVSFLFLFLPVFLAIDRMLNRFGRARNVFLIAASLLFYLWGESRGVVLLVELCLLNLLFGKILLRQNFKTQAGRFDLKKITLIIAIATNLAILVYYKYFAWMAGWFSSYVDLQVESKALPLGISFFTFHAISYLVDAYRGAIKEHSGIDFATYFFMFPHLVAGPIVRFENVRGDIQSRKFDSDLFCYGVFRFVIGINKKILIANSVAPIADMAFASNSTSLATTDAWLGILAYSVQIYFDFSAYSDMAIGLASMMGIRFCENFEGPYKSRSIKEFWRRWHISLSTWLRDYLFIPLGGSRCSKFKNYRNLLIVFLVCGIWHGAQFTFVVWGLFHGALLILEKTKFGQALSRLPESLQRAYCFVMVLFGWVFFRAENLSHAKNYFEAMFGLQGVGIQPIEFGLINVGAIVIGLLVALFGSSCTQSATNNNVPVRLYALNLLLFLLSIAVVYTNARNPFIYFNF